MNEESTAQGGEREIKTPVEMVESELKQLERRIALKKKVDLTVPGQLPDMWEHQQSLKRIMAVLKENQKNE